MEFEKDSNAGTDPAIEADGIPQIPDPSSEETTLQLDAAPEAMDARPSSEADDTVPRPQTAYERNYGYTPQTPSYPYAYSAPAPAPAAMPSVTPEETVGRGGSFGWGLLGGIIGAAAVAAVLVLSGLLVPRQGSRSTDNGIALPGQSFSINPTSEDVTVANAVAAKALPSVVLVHCTLAGGMSTGSGVILDASGNIITNNHVVEGAQSISVTIEGTSYDAVVVGTDPSSDIAVLKADLGGAQVTPIEVGDSSALRVGDWVMTVGSPFGLDSSVSAGIVSSLFRSELMYGESGNTLYTNLIQVDAAINPGNSGGALVNARGQLVGICTLFSSDTQSFAGIGFAIPGNYAVEIAEKIIAGEQVTHAYIGLTMMTVNSDVVKAEGLSVDSGALVIETIEDGPAEAAGILPGDVVISIGGERIDSADSAVLAVRSHRIGETVAVTVMRGEERLTFDVTLSSDEKLQEIQRQQREQQQKEQEQQNDFWSTPDRNGIDDEDVQEMLEWWWNQLTDGEDPSSGDSLHDIFAPDKDPRG